ncbi:MAG: hypothetical protein DI565_00575 [Ancylobacter novellus]|uniref:Uncharacterized protein n=1 Tax=Ancylobacter novellus TaxID=921 RepID=A0A2W5KSM9_ANCNO|nr:MAG: hypothetical protein DI565_00575 [Ancylobacter novellus]
MSAWTPEDYLDEVVPEPRESPTAWIVGRDGAEGWRLADIDGRDEGPADACRIVIPEGGVVTFCAFDDYGAFEIETLADGGWSCPDDIPADATHFCAEGDIDTLGESVDQFVAGLIENGYASPGETVRTAVYRWSDPIPHRLVVENGAARFVAEAGARI